MKRTPVVILFISCVFAGILILCYYRQSQKPKLSAEELRIRAECEQLTIGELIDRLQQVEDEGIGYHSTAWARGFVAVDEEAEHGGGVIGSYAPVVAPQLRELVRRGVTALPALLEHLTDARETGLTVGGHHVFGEGVFGGRWFSNEYDPRQLNVESNVPEVPYIPKWTEKNFTGNYTLRVGDLCFVAIGQIVNRRLNAVRYQPTSCLVVNSPVEISELAETVRKDWAGLDQGQHEQLLVYDLKSGSDPWRKEDAWKRLLFYCPERAKELKHLRPSSR